MTEQEFILRLKDLNIEINFDILNNLNLYYQMLIESNEKINLTSITNKEEVYLKHFYDSLTLNKIIDLNKELSLCDLGTGAGFPGLVLKIVFPNLKITLVDSLQKRILFLKEVIKKLDLKNIEVINERAEIFSKQVREKFDIVTARAVAKLNVLAEYAVPLLKINGNFIAMKANCEEELESINNALQKLNCEKKEIIEFYLPKELSKRTLVSIQKKAFTNLKYPRKFEQIKKNPL